MPVAPDLCLPTLKIEISKLFYAGQQLIAKNLPSVINMLVFCMSLFAGIFFTLNF